MSERPLVYTVPQAAEALAVSRSTVYRLIADGLLETIKVRSRTRVRPGAIDRYLDDLQRQQRERLVRL
jgi:excisionase family DNA binding protein